MHTFGMRTRRGRECSVRVQTFAMRSRRAHGGAHVRNAHLAGDGNVRSACKVNANVRSALKTRNSTFGPNHRSGRRGNRRIPTDIIAQRLVGRFGLSMHLGSSPEIVLRHRLDEGALFGQQTSGDAGGLYPTRTGVHTFGNQTVASPTSAFQTITYANDCFTYVQFRYVRAADVFFPHMRPANGCVSQV